MKGFKKALSLVLALLMAVGLVSVSAVKANAAAVTEKFKIKVSAPTIAGAAAADTGFEFERSLTLDVENFSPANGYKEVVESLGVTYSTDNVESATITNKAAVKDAKEIVVTFKKPVVKLSVTYYNKENETTATALAGTDITNPYTNLAYLETGAAKTQVQVPEWVDFDGNFYTVDPIAVDTAEEIGSTKTAKALGATASGTLNLYAVGSVKTVTLTLLGNGREFKKNANTTLSVVYGTTLDDALTKAKSSIDANDGNNSLFIEHDTNNTTELVGWAVDFVAQLQTSIPIRN